LVCGLKWASMGCGCGGGLIYGPGWNRYGFKGGLGSLGGWLENVIRVRAVRDGWSDNGLRASLCRWWSLNRRVFQECVKG
jgi:hypothetical protein